MASVEYRKPWNRKALRCFVAKTQNPVGAIPCRFDSDLRHLFFQWVRYAFLSPFLAMIHC